MKVMLDTNICIYVINESPSSVLTHFQQYAFQELGISSIVYAELLYGVYHSQQIDKNLTRLNELISGLSIVDFGEQAACQYGLLRATLKQQGKLIGPNDMLIAAHALALGVPLATNNHQEFKQIAGLQVLNWI